MSIIDTLVFDRAAADLQRVIALSAAAQTRELTAEELDEWNAALVRGAYNAEDLNRVGEAVIYAGAYLTTVQPTIDAYRAALGVASDAVFDAHIADAAEEITPRTDYMRDNTPIMRADIKKTMRAVTVTAARVGIAVAPDIDHMTLQAANAVERAIFDAYKYGMDAENTRKETADKIAAAWYCAGDLFCGEIE